MRIANYLRPECVALHQRADSLEGAVQQLVALLDGTEDLTDTAAFAADVRARLALGGAFGRVVFGVSVRAENPPDGRFPRGLLYWGNRCRAGGFFGAVALLFNVVIYAIKRT